MDDCAFMSEEMFVKAIGACRKNLRWFPTPKDVIQQYENIVRTIPDTPRVEYKPSMTHEQQMGRIKKIKAILSNNGETPVYVSAKYKSDTPKDKNIVYVPEPFSQNKAHYKKLGCFIGG